MTGFEPRISGIGSSANWATTTARWDNNVIHLGTIVITFLLGSNEGFYHTKFSFLKKVSKNQVFFNYVIDLLGHWQCVKFKMAPNLERLPSSDVLQND